MHLNPINVLHVLEDSIADNSILVADGGDFVATAAYVTRYGISAQYSTKIVKYT